MKVKQLRNWLSDVGEKNKQHYEKGLIRPKKEGTGSLGAVPRIDKVLEPTTSSNEVDSSPEHPSTTKPTLESSPNEIEDLREIPSTDPTTCTSASLPFEESVQGASWDTASCASWDHAVDFDDSMFDLRDAFEEGSGFKKQEFPDQEDGDIDQANRDAFTRAKKEKAKKPALLEDAVAASSAFHNNCAETTDGSEASETEGGLSTHLEKLNMKSTSPSESITGSDASSIQQSISPAVLSSQVGRALMGEPIGPTSDPFSQVHPIDGDYKQEEDQNTVTAAPVNPVRRKIRNPEDLEFLRPKRSENEKQDLKKPGKLPGLKPVGGRKFGKKKVVEVRKEELEKKWAESHTVKHEKKKTWVVGAGHGNYNRRHIYKKVPVATSPSAKQSPSPDQVKYSIAS